MEATFLKVCTVSDVQENQTIALETEGKNILVAKINGEFYAMENKCTHENQPLTGGTIYQGQIQCPHHGARFDLRTGKATQLPAIMELKTLEVKVENENVMVAI